MTSDGRALPGHAYVPTRTARHPEGTFDHLRDTARPGMSADDLSRCEAFQVGLLYLESGYYWEAHELLEPVWAALQDHDGERAVVQALIQVANGRLKLRMDRPRAALRLGGIARALVASEGSKVIMGLHRTDIVERVDSLIADASCEL